MKKSLFQQYQSIDEQIKSLELLKTDLRTAIIADMQSDSVEKVETDFGKFTIATRSSYTYSPAVKKLEEKVKLAKIKEEQKGVAERKETAYLVYSPVKDQE